MTQRTCQPRILVQPYRQESEPDAPVTIATRQAVQEPGDARESVIAAAGSGRLR
jgi:hypothetical protein